MSWQDGEQIVRKYKELSHDSADAYLVSHPMRQQPASRPTVRVRLLATIGGALVVIGYRLQSGYEQMTVPTLEPAEGLRFSSNGSGPCNC